jgi:hypothetical protein
MLIQQHYLPHQNKVYDYIVESTSKSIIDPTKRKKES